MNRMLLVLTLVVGMFSGVESKTLSKINWASPLTLTYAPTDGGGDGCDCFIKNGKLVFFNGSCGNYSFALISNAADGCGATTTTLAWDFGDSYGATGNFVNHQYTANGTYTVTLTVTVTSQYGVCTYQLTQVVTVSCFIDPPCVYLDCDSVFIKNIYETGVQFKFPIVDCEDCENPDYTIGWRRAGSTTWNYGGTTWSTSGNGSVFGLDSCMQYELIIELRCNGNEETPDASCIVPFTTTGCPDECIFDCASVVQTGSSYDRIYFSFTPIDTACTNCDDPYYDVSWRVAGSSAAWNYCCTSVAPGAGTGSIWGLSYCTIYEFRIELRCGGSHLSPVLATCGPVVANTRCFSPPAEEKLVQPGGSSSTNIMVYPNPASQMVKFAIESDLDVNGTIRIFNNMGALVKEIVSRTNQVEELSIEELGEGIYYYKFSTDDETTINKNGKLVILR